MMQYCGVQRWSRIIQFGWLSGLSVGVQPLRGAACPQARLAASMRLTFAIALGRNGFVATLVLLACAPGLRGDAELPCKCGARLFRARAMWICPVLTFGRGLCVQDSGLAPTHCPCHRRTQTRIERPEDEHETHVTDRPLNQRNGERCTHFTRRGLLPWWLFDPGLG